MWKNRQLLIPILILLMSSDAEIIEVIYQYPDASSFDMNVDKKISDQEQSLLVIGFITKVLQADCTNIAYGKKDDYT